MKRTLQMKLQLQVRRSWKESDGTNLRRGGRIHLEQAGGDKPDPESTPPRFWNEHLIRSQATWPQVPALSLTSDKAKSLQSHFCTSAYSVHYEDENPTPPGRAVRAQVPTTVTGFINCRAFTRYKESLLLITISDCPDLGKEPVLRKATKLRDFSILGPQIQQRFE